MSTKTILASLTSAADLLEHLESLKADGKDLSTVYVLASNGEEFATIGLRENTLTDGSITTDLVLWTSEQQAPIKALRDRDQMEFPTLRSTN